MRANLPVGVHKRTSETGIRIENFILQFFPLDNTFRLKKRVTTDAGQRRDEGIHGIKQSRND